MFFREFNFGTRMEHMRLSGRRLLSSLVTHKGRIAAVFWFVGYTAALHPDRLTRGRTEAIQWDSPPWCVMHRSIFFFPQKKWVRASARKKAFGCRSRQAKRSACPTRGWVKSSLRPIAANGHRWPAVLRGDAAFLFFLLFFSSSEKVAGRGCYPFQNDWEQRPKSGSSPLEGAGLCPSHDRGTQRLTGGHTGLSCSSRSFVIRWCSASSFKRFISC